MAERTKFNTSSPWVIDTREVGRRPGNSKRYHREPTITHELGLAEVIMVDPAQPVLLDVFLESALEGILVTGTASAPLAGECARCLDPIEDLLDVQLMELYAYPDSITEATTDDDEIHRLVGPGEDYLDLEPTFRDAVVLALPQSPLCREDCPGLCVDCGEKWADVGPNHTHETIDPRWAALQERLTGGAAD